MLLPQTMDNMRYLFRREVYINSSHKSDSCCPNFSALKTHFYLTLFRLLVWSFTIQSQKTLHLLFCEPLQLAKFEPKILIEITSYQSLW